LAPNLGWRDVPLGQMMSEALGLDVPVFVGNEADLGALAEHTRGAGAGVDDMLFISGEVGVGAGVIVAGQPLVGADGYAGEVGHMTVNPFGVECRCGSRGCWETEIGERALLREARRPDTGGRDAVAALLREAAAGSPTALAAMESVGTWLGVGLAGLINIFNPSRIVLGGLFARTYPYLAETVRLELDRRALFPARRLVDITSARLGDDSELMGAVELAFAPVLADPTIVPVRDPDRAADRGGAARAVVASDPAPA
ncbi:MAG TPA: ROK family protein, partial [Egibacteraceae bacterium]